MKNHESWPIETTSFPEANVVNFNRGRGRGHVRDRDRGRGIYNNYFRGGSYYNPNFKRTTWNDDHKGKAPQTLQDFLQVITGIIFHNLIISQLVFLIFHTFLHLSLLLIFQFP